MLNMQTSAAVYPMKPKPKMRVAVIGGDDRAKQVSWPEEYDVRTYPSTRDGGQMALARLEESVKNGGLDALVLLTKFAGHTLAPIMKYAKSKGLIVRSWNGSLNSLRASMVSFMTPTEEELPVLFETLQRRAKTEDKFLKVVEPEPEPPEEVAEPPLELAGLDKDQNELITIALMEHHTDPVKFVRDYKYISDGKGVPLDVLKVAVSSIAGTLKLTLPESFLEKVEKNYTPKTISKRPPPHAPDSEVVYAYEACEILGISKLHKFYGVAKNNKIQRFDSGEFYEFSRADVMRYLEKKSTMQPTKTSPIYGPPPVPVKPLVLAQSPKRDLEWFKKFVAYTKQGVELEIKTKEEAYEEIVKALESI